MNFALMRHGDLEQMGFVMIKFNSYVYKNVCIEQISSYKDHMLCTQKYIYI